MMLQKAAPSGLTSCAPHPNGACARARDAGLLPERAWPLASSGPWGLQIDELMLPLRFVGAACLNGEVGDRLRQIAPMRWSLCVLADHGCAGLDAIGPRVHGNLPAELQHLYATLLVEHDPLLACAAREWRPLDGTIEEHCAWLHEQMRHADLMRGWLQRSAAGGARHLVVVPARGWLSRGAVFGFFDHRPAEGAVLALFYAVQRMAVALELRNRPYMTELLVLRFTARELDVLRAGLQGTCDRAIAQRLGLSVDTIRYYFTRIKHRVPSPIGHLKPRELARVLHQLGKL